MTDRHTERHTDRQTPAILLSAPCYAIAMGQIMCIYLKNNENVKSKVQTFITSVTDSNTVQLSCSQKKFYWPACIISPPQ